jgi:CDP-diacylglycerol---glycerol-3-phosphate 3-phosphatidyltransferase
VAWVVLGLAVLVTVVTGLDIALKAMRLRRTSERAAMKRARRRAGRQ